MNIPSKILVIKPPYSTFPVGFAYVLACLEEHKVPFDFIDVEFGHKYKKLLKKDDYFAVATGGLIGHFDFFHEIIQHVHKVRPGLPVIIGGNITKDIRPDFLIDKMGADFGIVGEAETSLPYLLDALVKRSGDFNDIPGVIFKDPVTGAIKRNTENRLDLSVNIVPAWHHIDVDYYSKICNIGCWGNHLRMPVLTGRGCVGRCSFCSPTIGAFRMRPIEHVISEMKYLNSKYDFEQFVFMNEMLYKSKEEIERFCNAYKGSGIGKSWLGNMRVDSDIDVDTFLLMKSSGCISVGAGIESGSDKILKLMNKRTTAEQIKKFFRNAKKAGLSCTGTFLVGNEGETETDLKETIDMVIKEEMNTVESLTNAYPGTLIYKNALSRGLIKDEWDYLRQLRFGCDLWDYTWTDRRHINITEIPDEKFWDTIVRESRRFNTFLLDRFKIKNISYRLPFGLLIRATGSCPECGGAVSVVSRRTLLGLKAFCKDCFQPVIFNMYELEEFKSHFGLLRSILQETKSLVVFGAMKEAVSLLRYDYFGFTCDKIVGFIDINNGKTDPSEFIYKPRLQMADLLDIKPDTILIVDDYFGDAELVIRLFFIKKGLPAPRIAHLWPDSKRWDRAAIRLVEKYKAGSAIDKTFSYLVTRSVLFLSRARKAFLSIMIYIYPRLLRLKQLNWVRTTLAKWKE